MWQEIADRVHVRRHTELDQTIGLVVGDERCLVVDTGLSEPHGRELLTTLRSVTRLPVTAVITHAHWDHFLGTAAFLPCPVWAHERCVPAMAENAEEDRATWVRHYRDAGKPGLADDLAAARLVVPTELFADTATLDLGGRTVVLRHPGRGHTDNDVVVDVPDARVVFAGDLVEQGGPPNLGGDSHPLDWPSTLDVLLGLAPEVVVPGHGDPVDSAFTRDQRDELARVAELIRAVGRGELTAAQAVARSPYPIDPALF